MKNQRAYSDYSYNPSKYGWYLVNHQKYHDFSVRCVCANPGPAEVFDQSINSNYVSVLVLDGYDKEEIRRNFELIVWTEEDFEICTTMNYYDKELLQMKYEEVINRDSNVSLLGE